MHSFLLLMFMYRKEISEATVYKVCLFLFVSSVLTNFYIFAHLLSIVDKRHYHHHWRRGRPISPIFFLTGPIMSYFSDILSYIPIFFEKMKILLAKFIYH